MLSSLFFFIYGVAFADQLLLNYYFTSAVDIHALRGGLTVELATVKGIPSLPRPLQKEG